MSALMERCPQPDTGLVRIREPAQRQQEDAMAREATEMARQLEFWGRRIRELTEQSERSGKRMSFEELMNLDELRALHVIATSRLEALQTASDTERTSIEGEIDIMSSELQSALGRPRPRVCGTNGTAV